MLAKTVSRPRSLRFVAVHWLAASVITAAALAIFLNGSFFSAYSAPHVDFSINFAASHALRHGENPYGATTLYSRAKSLDSPTQLIYGQLFTSYIQPPTSALSLLPLTVLPWRDASRVYLAINHLLLLAGVGLSLYTLRPRLSLPWLIAGASVIVAFYSQIYASFSLGQVDAGLLLLFSIAFWAYCRDKQAITGSAIAIAAAIKLVPALLLLYFLWKRQYRAVAWGAAVGLALFLLSFAFVGPRIYETYFTDTLPALAKGSTHYSNASIGAAIARSQTPEVIRGLPYVYYLDEVPSGNSARAASAGVLIAGLVALAVIIPRRLHARRVQSAEYRVQSAGPAARDPAATEPVPLVERRPETLLLEFYLVVAVTLIVSSVTWEFYVIWLLPAFLAAFLAPAKLLPPGAWRWLALFLLGLAFVALNYPGDFYLFGRNDSFYHPEWVPGVWVEGRVQLYHKHSDAILYLRLPALLLVAGILSALTLWRRRQIAPSHAP